VALASPPAGTNERVLLDPEGRVSRIQRYYDNVTWSFASGVACSMLPVSSALLVRNLPFASLPTSGRLWPRGLCPAATCS
jgi:hypothetical protein